ncbi:MAG: glutaredoxin family protein [Deltaproteobacteria bacterium]|nr:glutaredoxin family protein [Deltaproteobacteria bacterium]
MEKPRVKLYALSVCEHCKCAKKLLSDCEIEFECADLDKVSKEEVAAILEEVKKLNARCSFPTLVIGDKVIVGFREQEIREALGL